MIQGIVIWVFSMASWAHPFHLSICEIEYRPQSQTLQVSCRIFLDDLEIALNQENNVDNYFENKSQQHINQDLETFLKEHFSIAVNDKERSPRYLGYEIEDNVIWCYLEIEKIKNLQNITVGYTVLLDTFDDQINLAHIKFNDKVKSLRFQKGKTTGTLQF